MKTMKDYDNLYLKCDVLLLADVFGKFKNNNLKNCGLFLSHYLCSPALSLGAVLNMKKVELELIPNPGIFIFFEKVMRAGVSYTSNRYSKAKNKYLKCYHPKQESKHIIYVGANNSYGYAMSKFLRANQF